MKTGVSLRYFVSHCSLTCSCLHLALDNNLDAAEPAITPLGKVNFFPPGSLSSLYQPFGKRYLITEYQAQLDHSARIDIWKQTDFKLNQSNIDEYF